MLVAIVYGGDGPVLRRRWSSLLTGGGVLVAIREIVRDNCQRRTSPGKRGRLVTRAYLPPAMFIG